MNDNECANCGARGVPLKQGWTNSLYCSEQCECRSVSRLHGDMPGSGGLPRLGWMPHHIRNEISRRWEDDNA